MQAAYLGDRGTWARVSLAMRDAMVSHALATTPYYAKLLDGAPPADFTDIPVLTKDLASEHFNELFSNAVPVERRLRLSTSGSSGNPFAFVRDLAQGALEDGSGRRMLLWICGLPLDVTTVWFAGHAPNNRPGVRSMPASRYTPAELAAEMTQWGNIGQFILYGPPTIIEWVAEQVESGVPSAGKPTAVVTTGEMLSDATRQHLAEVFACPVHAWYGAQETGGYLGATLDGTDRYALNPLLTWAEVVDEAGRGVKPGEQGRLLLTDLNNWAFPFIRYDVGDLATWSGDSRGAFPIIGSLDGRTTDRITLPSGRIFSAGGFGGWVFVHHRLGTFVRRFQLIQTQPDAFEMLVVWRDPPTPALIERLTVAVRDMLDAGTSLKVVSVDDIPPDLSGKTPVLKRAY